MHMVFIKVVQINLSQIIFASCEISPVNGVWTWHNVCSGIRIGLNSDLHFLAANTVFKMSIRACHNIYNQQKSIQIDFKL